MAPKNPYSNIIFDSHVDWVHIKPELLQKINMIARSRNETVEVFSGYRDSGYNRKVGGADNSAHTHGEAVDAYVNGKPIGEVWPASAFTAARLRSGNQPGFFHGKPDPEHVDLRFDGSTGGGAIGGGDITNPSGASSTGQGVAASDLIQSDLANSPPLPIGPNVIEANDVTKPAYGVEPKPQAETWQLLASIPGASPDTMRLAQMAGYDANAGA